LSQKFSLLGKVYETHRYYVNRLLGIS
jgi:hypothetical protein